MQAVLELPWADAGPAGSWLVLDGNLTDDEMSLFIMRVAGNGRDFRLWQRARIGPSIVIPAAELPVLLAAVHRDLLAFRGRLATRYPELAEMVGRDFGL